MSDSPNGQALGDAIRAVREQAGDTQRLVAERAAIDVEDYKMIERGERELRLDAIVQIAAALHVSAAELFKRAKL